MSTAATASALLDTLRKTGLYDGPAFDELLQVLAEAGLREADGRTVARWLVRQHYLTRFQAKQILAGKHKNFIVNRKYLILEPLGSGGMGAVYRCRHLTLNKDLALKVLPPKLTNDPAALQRFLREARALAALNHPNIVQAHDCDEARGQYFLVMGYVDGVTLQQLVDQQGPLPVTQAAYYIAQACAGLQHAHQAGWVHRDLKPSNLVVDRTDTVKLLDLGLARLLIDPADPMTKLSEEDCLLGSPDYLSPEQSLNTPDIDIRSDIYSLGATLYFLLAGKAPFDGLPLMSKLLAHQMQTPPDLRQFRSDVSVDLVAVVRRMMAKVPTARFPSPGVVAEALRPWAAGYKPNPHAVPETHTEKPERLYAALRGPRHPATSQGSMMRLSDPLFHGTATGPRSSARSDPLFPPLAPSAPALEEHSYLNSSTFVAGHEEAASPFPGAEPDNAWPAPDAEDDLISTKPSRGMLVAVAGAVAGLAILALTVWVVIGSGEGDKASKSPPLTIEQQALLRADDLCRQRRWPEAAQTYASLLLNTAEDAKRRRELLTRLLVAEREPVLPHLAQQLPTDTSIQESAGQYLFNNKNFAQSWTIYQTLTGPGKGEHNHWQMRAMCELHLGRWDDATRSLERGMAVNSSCIRCRTSLTFLAAHQQQRELYRRQCSELLQRLDQIPDAATAALVGLACGQTDQPREVLLRLREKVDRYAELNATSSQLRLAQALLCLRLGELDAALEAITESETHQASWSGSPVIKPIKVVVLQRLGRRAEADQEYRSLTAWRQKARQQLTPTNQSYLPGCWDTVLMETLFRETEKVMR